LGNLPRGTKRSRERYRPQHIFKLNGMLRAVIFQRRLQTSSSKYPSLLKSQFGALKSPKLFSLPVREANLKLPAYNFFLILASLKGVKALFFLVFFLLAFLYYSLDSDSRSMAALWEMNYQELLGAASPGDCNTTPDFALSYPIISTPLLLPPRDWSDNYYPFSALGESSDFQTNHGENARSSPGTTSSLTGLGIKNLDLAKGAGPIYCAPYFLDSVSRYSTHERRQTPRTTRNVSIYDTRAEKGKNAGCSLQKAEDDSESNSSWSFSSVLKAAELAASRAISTVDASLPSDLTVQDISQLCTDPDSNIVWSFEELSATAGLSVAEFAAQISATAELTLKRMAAGQDLPLEERSSSFESIRDLPKLGIANDAFHAFSWPVNRSPEPTLPIVDVSLRTLNITSWNNDCVGVNPADIMPASPQPASLSTPPGRVFLVHPSENQTSTDPLPESEPGIVHTISGLRSFGVELDRNLLGPPHSLPYHDSYELQLSKSNASKQLESEDEALLSQSPSTSEYSPSLLSLGQKHIQPIRVTTRSNARNNSSTLTGEKHIVGSPDFQNDCNGSPSIPINLGTPVFDAHRGIDIEELKAKAERYRLRNQGRDYDKRWLISFAGKLSARGELVEEFRCYVAGCKQVNKRRDHILIHVGAHLDQRPFKCLHWYVYLRFLFVHHFT